MSQEKNPYLTAESGRLLVAFDADLARELKSVASAVIYNNIIYNLRIHKYDVYDIDGETYYCQSIKEIARYLGCYTEKQVRTALENLVKRKKLITADLSPDRLDRPHYYRLPRQNEIENSKNSCVVPKKAHRRNNLNPGEKNEENEHLKKSLRRAPQGNTLCPPGQHGPYIYTIDKHINREERAADSDESRLSYFLFEKMNSFSEFKSKPNIKTWEKDIRLMLAKDKISENEIVDMITWLFGPDGDPFWQSNIQSAKKLRDKWRTISLQRSSKNKKQEPKIGNREKVQKWFKHGAIYSGKRNGVPDKLECLISDESIAFQSYENYQCKPFSLKFLERGFDSQFDNLLRKLGLEHNKK
jgi:hypothetical protein